MRRLFAAAAITALTVLTAACGSDEETATTQEAAEESPEGAASDTTADGTEDVTVPEDTATVETEGDDSGDQVPSGDLSADECAEVAKLEGSEDGDFSDIVDAIDEVKDLTPEEIDDDLETVQNAFREFQVILDDAGGDLVTAATDPEVAAKIEALDSPELQAANDRLEAFFADACPGLDS